MKTKTKTTWRKVKLGEVADIKMGQSPRSEFYNSRGEGLPFYQGVTDFGEKYPKKSIYCSQPTKIAEAGDVFFSVRAPVGNVNVAIEKSCIGRGVAALRMKNGNNDFLYFFLKNYERYFKNISGGTTYESINKDQIEDIELSIPEDPNEQKRIADVLSAFDEKIELNNKINQTLEQMAQAIFKEWFVSPSIALAEEDKLPKGWRVGKLGELMVARKEKFRKYEEWKNLKLLDLGRFPQKSLAITSYGKGEEIKTAGIGFKKGDVLFGAVRPYFHKVVIAPFDGVTNSSVFVITPKKESSYAFLVTVLFSENTVNYASMSASGTKMPVIKWEDLCDMEVLIPEERAIENFNKTVKNFYNLIIKNTLENQKLASLCDLLLPKLMSGKILVKS